MPDTGYVSVLGRLLPCAYSSLVAVVQQQFHSELDVRSELDV